MFGVQHISFIKLHLAFQTELDAIKDKLSENNVVPGNTVREKNIPAECESSKTHSWTDLIRNISTVFQ